MKSNETVTGKYEFPRLGALCPRCYYRFTLGEISLNVKVKLAPSAPISAIAIHPGYAMNSNPESQFAPALLEITCPSCQERMLIVDDKIIDDLAALNRHGLFTRYSCDGDGDCRPYVSFWMNGKEFIALLQEIAKAYELKLEQLETGELILSPSEEPWDELAPLKSLKFEHSSIYFRDFSGPVENFWNAVNLFADLAYAVITEWAPEEESADDETAGIMKRLQKQVLEAFDPDNPLTLSDVLLDYRNEGIPATDI